MQRTGSKILEARFLAPEVKWFRVEAPRIARKQQPGQFVMVRVHDQGERIPLTIAGSDPNEGSITLIVQGVGKTTKLLNTLEAGDRILDVVGPLGKPSQMEKVGTCVVVAGGVGAAIAYPTARALKGAGNRVVVILGARNRALMILEGEMRSFADELIVTTDDGSYGQQGLVTDALRKMIGDDHKMDLVFAVGPIPMMQAVAELTRPHGIRTVVSLNPIMVDGTGMCGGCRVVVGGKSQFACVDGPEFDAHQVDFDALTKRNALYRDAELRALAELLKHRCKLAEAT